MLNGKTINPMLLLAIALVLPAHDAAARDPVPATGTGVQAAPAVPGGAALAQGYSVTVTGRVSDAKGGGIGGAQIYWAHVLQPATPADPCADAEAARDNPDCGGLRIGGALGDAIQGRLAEAQRAATGGAGEARCAMDRRLLDSRGPLATTGADGVYRITLRFRGDDEACSRMISELRLRDLPPLAAKKSGYSFRRDKGGATPSGFGGAK